MAKLDSIKWHCGAMLHYRIDTKVWQHVCIRFLLLSFLFEIFQTQTAFKLLLFLLCRWFSIIFAARRWLLLASYSLHLFSGENCACLKTLRNCFHSSWSTRRILYVFSCIFSIWWSVTSPTACVCVCLCWYTKYEYLHRVPYHVSILHKWEQAMKVVKANLREHGVCNEISEYYFI